MGQGTHQDREISSRIMLGLKKKLATTPPRSLAIFPDDTRKQSGSVVNLDLGTWAQRAAAAACLAVADQYTTSLAAPPR